MRDLRAKVKICRERSLDNHKVLKPYWNRRGSNAVGNNGEVYHQEYIAIVSPDFENGLPKRLASCGKKKNLLAKN